MGRYGAFVQIGTKEDVEKPKFAGLRPGQKMDTIALDAALDLFKLPRELGATPEGEPVSANIGRFGPYVRYANKFVSIKGDDPYTITLERALELIAEKKIADANRLIRDFPEAGIQVLNGRYGPYITNKLKNAKIPKDKVPNELTLEECQALLAAAPERRGRGMKRKAPLPLRREPPPKRRRRPKPKRRPTAPRKRRRRRKRRRPRARKRAARSAAQAPKPRTSRRPSDEPPRDPPRGAHRARRRRDRLPDRSRVRLGLSAARPRCRRARARDQATLVAQRPDPDRREPRAARALRRVAARAAAQRGARARWPGPHTWVLDARADAPRWITGGRSSVAVRVTAHPVARELCLAVGEALVSTSANVSRRPPHRRLLRLRRDLGSRRRLRARRARSAAWRSPRSSGTAAAAGVLRA